MNEFKRARIKKIALQRMRDSANDSDRWSFVYVIDGAVSYSCCFFEKFQEFDGIIENIGISWSQDKIDKILDDVAELSSSEFAEWQRSRCIYAATNCDESASTVWITPVRIKNVVEGYAVFISENGGAAEDEPSLWDVVEEIEDALADLREVAIVVEV